MREAETIDFLEVLDTNIKRIDRLMQLLDGGRRITGYRDIDINIFHLADDATSEARDMIDELMKMHARQCSSTDQDTVKAE